MEIQTLKEYIVKNNKIEFVLEHLGCDNISSTHKDWIYSTYPNTESDNPKGVCIHKNSLAFKSMSKGIKGDLISLVMQVLSLDLYNTIKWFMKILKLSDDIVKSIKCIKPFNGYYSDIQRYICHEDITLPTYNLDVLDKYLDKPSYRFLLDRISLETQSKYRIMFDEDSNRIVMPCISESGIIGVLGRLNKDILYKNENKYIPLIAYKKSQFLYGYAYNYKYLLNNRIYIFEAEKSVLQADTKGIYNTVAVGSNTISKYHKKILYEMSPTEIIIAFDEGIEESYIIEQCNKLKNKNTLIQTKIGYIYDNDNKYLRKYEKQSPIECNNWEGLIKNKIKWV